MWPSLVASNVTCDRAPSMVARSWRSVVPDSVSVSEPSGWGSRPSDEMSAARTPSGSAAKAVSRRRRTCGMLRVGAELEEEPHGRAHRWQEGTRLHAHRPTREEGEAVG